MYKISYDHIDIMKFIASIMIFAMHGTVFYDYENLQLVLEIASRWGVPFFFICSSFFLLNSESGQLTDKNLVRYCKRISILYVSWFIINIPQIFYSRLYLRGLLDIWTYIGFIKSIFFSSTYTGSWYLISSIYAAWIIYLLSKRFNTKQVLLITAVTQMICIFSSSYNAFLPRTIASALTGDFGFLSNVFGGCFYFAIGKYIVEHKKRILNLFSLKGYCILGVIFYLFSFIEMYFIIQSSKYVGSDASFCIIPVAIVVFIICIKIRGSISNHLIFRKISTIVYCGQGNILIFKSVIAKLLGINSSILSFFFALIMMVLLVYFVLLLQQNNDNHWTRSLT